VDDRLSWSDEVYRIFGLEPQAFGATYEAFLAVVHPDDHAAVDEAYSGSLGENRDGYEIEHRVVRPAAELRRASPSIPLNIAEGSGKTTGPDQRRFWAMARGSATECAAIVDACVALKLVESAPAHDVDDLFVAIVRMLSKMCLE
jgi:four helix bundle protein